MNYELVIPWRKAEATADNGTCFEVAKTASGRILMRDSKLGDASPLLDMSVVELACFLDGAKKGEFDDLL